MKWQQIIAKHWLNMTPAQVAAAKLSCDNSWKAIAKLIPDLKAVEITGEVTQNLTWDPLPVTGRDLTRLSSTFTAGALPSPSGIDEPERRSSPSTNSFAPH